MAKKCQHKNLSIISYLPIQGETCLFIHLIYYCLDCNKVFIIKDGKEVSVDDIETLTNVTKNLKNKINIF